MRSASGFSTGHDRCAELVRRPQRGRDGHRRVDHGMNLHHDVVDRNTNHERLATQADRLRALHRAGDLLILVNVWDAASGHRRRCRCHRHLQRRDHSHDRRCRRQHDAAVGRVRGRRTRRGCRRPRRDRRPRSRLRTHCRITRRATAAAGAGGINLEDSDHVRPGQLRTADEAAERLATVRDAAHQVGVGIVVTPGSTPSSTRAASTPTRSSPKRPRDPPLPRGRRRLRLPDPADRSG